MQTSIVKVAVIVGLPETVRSRIQAKFKGVVDIRPIPLARDGGYRLDPPPPVAKDLVEKFADAASSYEHLAVIVLPYHGTVDLVEESLQILEGLGSKIYRTPPDETAWPKPSRGQGMDNDFQKNLIAQVCKCLDNCFPEDPVEDDIETIKFEVLRGLASHNKMGENNHSHEDDLWKERAKGLGPRGRDQIIKELMAVGILDRKKNKSQGGTGWVYWIDDVQKARTTYPDLAGYL